MKILLISPKGPLYRYKGGLFKKSLRYQPLTLTTLAAYIPEELDVELELIDEGIQVIPDDLQADLVAMTVITGTAKRAYELAWKKTYRWSSIAKRLYTARNFRPLALSVNLGYRFYAHHLHEYYNCDVQITPVITNPVACFASGSLNTEPASAEAEKK